MYELKKKIRKLFASKFVGIGPSSYEKRIYLAAVSQKVRNTVIGKSPLQISRLRPTLEYNIAIYLTDMEYENLD